MTLTQLEYLVAVDTHRHFARAAEACFVTQPSLSMQVQKLEEELGVRLFDRSRQPVTTTAIGAEVVQQARVILQQCRQLKTMIAEQRDGLSGEVRVGVIPTIAPYLLPLFLPRFLEKHTEVKLSITERTTDELLKQLKTEALDVGVVAGPLNDPDLTEYPLFYEELVVYTSPQCALFRKKYAAPDDIDPSQLWLLEEGHCLRSQIENLCQLRRKATSEGQFAYHSGSLETLRRLVDSNQGLTILPELATRDFTDEQMELVRYFQAPAPVREVSLVTRKHYARQRVVAALSEQIKAVVPAKMAKAGRREVVELTQQS
jgi:LysR family hydrogen peroxide-inducible transcriptional activator